jgi:hypothetical protein
MNEVNINGGFSASSATKPNASGSSDFEVLLPHPRHVRFWIKGGRLVTANRLVQTEIGIDRSVCKAAGLVARCPPAPANKTSEDESEECSGRKIATLSSEAKNCKDPEA